MAYRIKVEDKTRPPGVEGIITGQLNITFRNADMHSYSQLLDFALALSDNAGTTEY